MHTAYFDTQTALQSNTTYRFDPEKSNIYLTDTQETPDPKYHDICASDRERSVLRTAFYLKGLENVTLVGSSLFCWINAATSPSKT